ncbi:MAG: hypothetical protein DMG10_00485 [Acidobacteria bacterium]|nr:MAG: hypothetical protein DMG10_00485 [Acidobacteriota bacterium]
MDWKSRVRAAFAGASHMPDEDVIEELAQHARAMYDTARADGCSHEEAEQRLVAQLDRWRLDAASLRRSSRRPPAVEPPPAASASSPLAGLSQDVNYSLRLLRRQPRFALLVTLTMALGICATTVLFSVTYSVLMKPLPWPNADRIVRLKETRGGIAPRFNSFTNAAYVAWGDEADTIETLAAWSLRAMTLSGAGDPDRIRVAAVTASLFPLLGARPLIGNVFEEQDEILKRGSVVILSERLWRHRFGADPSVLGRVVQLEGRPHTIVGVLPGGLAFPDQQTLAWVSFRVLPATGNLLSMFDAVAKLRPGATAAQAAAEGTARGRFALDTGLTTTAIFGNNGPIEISAAPLRDALTVQVRRPLITLLVAVLLLLVSATANVASLQLARATTRRREMAIRAALGAGSARVTRQLLVESLLLALLGGGAGFLLAGLLHRVLPSLLPADFPRVEDLAVNATVVLFAFVTSMLAGLVFGVLPALRVRRMNLVESLAEDGGAAGGIVTRSRTAQVRMLIMAGQVAIAFVLLIGASLLGRSFVAMLKADRGWDPAGIVTARLSLSAQGYSPERRFALVEQILNRLAAVPGVTAAFTSELPLTPGGSTSALRMRSTRGDGGTISAQASPRIVSPHVFPALGMRIVAGRGFTDGDTDTSMRVVVVNRAFANRYLDDSPIGAKLPDAGYTPKEGETRESTVIGIVDDVRYVTAGDLVLPEMYYSHRQMRGQLPVPVVTLLLRTTEDPRALVTTLRSAVREADDRLVPEAVATMEDWLLTTLARPRLYAIVLGAFAAFALAIAGVGLFGVLSYTLAQRSRELAVRAALGARPADIIGLVLQQGLLVTIAGLAAGLVGSLWLTRLLSSQLYGVTRDDALTYVVVPVLLLVVAAAACAGPAWRAARLDPVKVLRGV